MVDAIVSYAVEKLGEFLIQEIRLPQKLRNDVEWLQNELEYIQSFLEDAEQSRKQDRRVEKWVSEIRKIANEAVDILENFTPESRSFKCGLACIWGKANPHYIITKIESLKTRVEDISRKRKTFGIGNINDAEEGPSNDLNDQSMIRRLRRATSYADEEEELLVRLEDAFETFLSVLLNSEPRRTIVSIYGMGGLGKTTLARQLYNANLIKFNFPYRAWVCVSQEYNTLDLLRTVIKSFHKGSNRGELEMLEKMNQDDLERYLRDLLMEHKYLVVVDDMWHRQAWESLKRAFPDSKNGSRVIVTTRKKEVAERVDERTFAHELRFLSTEESWDLFYKKICQGDGHANWCSTTMLDIGKAMVNKCGGLPLAIIVLGGLLWHKRGLEEWRKVKNHIWGHLKNDSIEIEYILSLSYNDLSSKLKKCFLYLGMFPEDYVIDAEKLSWLWMAEDLIPPDKDIAQNFLQELYNRCLVQVADRYRGITLGCRIHDLLRDLAVEKANQVNLFGIYDPRKNSYPRLPQRHAIHSQPYRYLTTHRSMFSLRTLLFFDHDFGVVPEDCWKKLRSVFTKFRYLRVLDLENLRRTRFFPPSGLPKSIGNLTHLQFLGLTYPLLIELPPSIGKLKKLLILQAYTLDHVTTIPLEISKLKNLRHFFARPEGIFKFDTLTNLRTLRYVRYDQWVVNNVEKLIHLRELAIEEIHKPNGNGDNSLDSISKLVSLETLSLYCSYEEAFPELEFLSSCQNLLKLKLLGRIENLPPHDKFPQSLTMLTLSHTQLKEDPMLVLGRLPNLKNLELQSFYDGERITFHAGGFCQLEFLYLLSLYNLEECQLAEGAMPMLKALQISCCPKLTVPDRMQSIPDPDDLLERFRDRSICERYPFLFSS